MTTTPAPTTSATEYPEHYSEIAGGLEYTFSRSPRGEWTLFVGDAERIYAPRRTFTGTLAECQLRAEVQS